MKKHSLWLVMILTAALPRLAYAQTAISACGTTITTPGPYVVTANLTNASGNTPCIAVKAYPVSIDLGGFTINSTTGGSSGIYGAQNYLSVRNGIIRNFHIGINATGDKGVKLDNLQILISGQGAVLGDDAQVSNSLFDKNGVAGLLAGANALVAGCTFSNTKVSGNGFEASGAGATVQSSTAAGNGGAGFKLAGGATLIADTARANLGNGFSNGASPSAFLNNAAVGNGADGFADLAGSAYQDNIAANNTSDGFQTAGAGGIFTGNTSTGNGTGGSGYGYNMACPTNLIGNTAYSNQSGSETESGAPACQKVNDLFP